MRTGFSDGSDCVGVTVTYGQLWSDWATWRPARSERWLMAGLRVDAHGAHEEMFLLMEALAGVMHIDDPSSPDGQSHAVLGFGLSTPIPVRSIGQRQALALSVVDLTYIVTPSSVTSNHRLLVSTRLSLEFTGLGK